MSTLRRNPVSTTVYDLNNDALVEILSRLSTIKHMVRCKLVSKLWCTLISAFCIPKITCSSSPVYGLLFSTAPYATGARGPWSLACLNGVEPNNSLVESCLGNTLPFSPSPSDLLDCCNGMLLFFDRSSMQYCVCNPSTEQYVKIPNSPPQSLIPNFGALIFDPYYKVIHIVHSWHAVAIHIFSPATLKWYTHLLRLESSVALSPWISRSVFLDGSVYRLSMSGHLLQFGVREIIGCRAIELPKNPVRTNAVGCLGVSQDSLHYAWINMSSQIMIWKFVEDGHIDEWLLKHTICLPDIDGHPLCSDLQSHSPFSVYAFHPTSDLLFIGNLAGIFCYDSDRKSLETICKLPADKSIFSGHSLVFPFSVNLNPLDVPEIFNAYDPANRWQPPPPEFLKVNFNVAFSLGSKAEAGAAVVRDCSGAVLACTYRRFESYTMEEAESMAALMAIQTAKEIKAAKVMFESDAEYLMLALEQGDKGNPIWKACYSFQRCIFLKNTAFSDVRFSWVRTEFNNSAHELAQWALNCHGNPPRFTESAIKPLSVI